ncbi:MAG TPA: flagellar biosynthesis anti-sigma factor FlgM [Cellvibrionaceae bacterium]
MAIDTTNTYKPGGPAANRTGTNPVAPAKTESGKDTDRRAESTDTVNLSEQAQTLNRLQETIAAAPDINTERVAEIRQAISEGRFEINAGKLAEAMLQQDELLG